MSTVRGTGRGRRIAVAGLLALGVTLGAATTVGVMHGGDSRDEMRPVQVTEMMVGFGPPPGHNVPYETVQVHVPLSCTTPAITLVGSIYFGHFPWNDVTRRSSTGCVWVVGVRKQ